MVITVPAATPAVSPTPSPSRRRALAWALVGSVLIGGPLIWHLVASQTLDEVGLVYDQEPIACDGATVESRPSSDNPNFVHASVVLTEGMSCRLRMHVANRSGSPVVVEDVTLLGLAPGNVLQIDVQFVNPNGQHGEGVDFDYRFPLTGGIAVAPGAIETLEAVLSYEGGTALSECTAQGWRIPSITVSALGQSRVLESPPNSEVFFSVGSVADCNP